MTRFWLGGYGTGMDGSAEGIGLLAGDAGREADTLAYRGPVAPVASPSWLAQHPTLDVVYAALEGDAAVQAFARTGESALASLGDPIAAGQSVCHLAVAPSGAYLIASCYGDGRVVRIGLDAVGRLAPDARDRAAALRAALLDEPVPDAGPAGVAAAASDPYASTGSAGLGEGAASASTGSASLEGGSASVEGGSASAAGARVSHAHAAAFLPDGRIATTDLGFDLVRIWRPGATGLLLDHEVVLPRGTGPRHMVVHPSGHLHVVTEYSCEVFTLAPSPDGHWNIVAATLVTPAAVIGTDFPAELSRSRDGATLYAGVRGSNTIAALRVRGAGESVEPIALSDSGVDWPRHHLVHEGKMLVAGQRSDTVSLLDLDERTGVPTGIRHRASAPAPTHLLLAR